MVCDMNNNLNNEVTPSFPRATARAQMADGSYWKAPVGTPVLAYFARTNPEWIPTLRKDNDRADQPTLVAAVVNGSLRELTFKLLWDANVSPVFLSDSDGWRIYRRSLAFVMVVAIRELFPDHRIRINHSVPFGGYYCEVDEGESFDANQLAQIKTRMQEIVSTNEEITREAVPLAEVISYYEEVGDSEKLSLLKNRDRDFLILYTLRGVRDYFHGYMVPSTGYLVHFDIEQDDEKGFLLRFPRREDGGVIRPVAGMPKLRQVFNETAEWLQLLDVRDIGSLNQVIRDGRLQELILASEALHERRYAEIAAEILHRQPDVRLVTLAGPSSSGKTTSSKRLAIQLLAHGLKPFTVAMDDYFVSRDRTPRDASGEYDFENIGAVDLDLFNEHMMALMDGQEVQLPRYNFKTGTPEKGETVRLTRDHVLIVEGIHALNPELVRDIPPKRVFKLYVSALTQLNIDRYNRIATTDVRLMRRMVRDIATRGISCLDTLGRWPSVRRGEHTWIFPYQENADMMFNSALVYEMAVLKPIVEPMLLAVDRGDSRYQEAKRLLATLKWVEPARDLDLVPSNSILREFIGGSNLEHYIPGHVKSQNH